MEEEFIYYNLPNGIRGVHQHSSSPVAHFGITIRAGSRDELPHEQGLAHFIEHCIFKGTKKRKPFHILSRLDSVGGEINAYTTKEETCIYASFLSVYYERAVELIADILFNSIFPAHEIEKEKEVIIDEINYYLDSPSEQIFDDFEEYIFPNHPFGRNILGTKESLKKFTSQDIFAFIERNYSPQNMVFSSVGNIHPNKLKKQVEKHFSQDFTENNKIEKQKIAKNQPFDKKIVKHTNQVHALLGGQAYSMQDDRRKTMILLNNVLGGIGLNNRLNLNIREKYGLTYTIESNYTAYSDTGLFSIYFSAENKACSRIIKLVNKELNQLKTKKMGVNQLHLAKQQLKGQIALAQENKSGLMQAIGKSLLYFNEVDTNAKIFKEIEAITASQLMEVANETFDEKKLSVLMYQ